MRINLSIKYRIKQKPDRFYYIQYLKWWWPWWCDILTVNHIGTIMPRRFSFAKSAELFLDEDILHKTKMRSQDRWERRRKIKSILSCQQ